MIVVVRRLCTGLALTLFAAAGTASAQPSQSQPAGGRIALINARQLLQAMPGYAKAESLYAKEAQAAQGEAQRLQAAMDSSVAAYQQSQPMLSPSARTTRERSLSAQNDSLQVKLQALQERVGNKERELLQPMQTRLSAIIDGVRAEGNYSLVIDMGNPAAGGLIVSFDKALDITVLVARRLAQSN